MIKFEAEEISMPALDFDRVRDWINSVTASHGYVVRRLSYLFCDDAYILKMNRKHLGHDYYTDIITFDYTNGKKVAGDMLISLDTVRSNAAMLGVSPNRELLRVIIHGVLHLCGINDKGPGEREIMESHEDAALALWSEMEPKSTVL